MNFKEFLADKKLSCALASCALLTDICFMRAYGVPWEVTLFCTAVLMTALFIALMVSFLKKRSFYNTLNERLEMLDKKYLICETLDTPGFIEGRILCNTLYRTNKAMCEEIDIYRRSVSELADFVELWVHEIKLPLSSLELMLYNSGYTDKKALKQLRRIDNCIDTVLYYSRAENAEKDYIIKPVSLRGAVAEAVKKLREDMLLSGAELDMELNDINVMTDSKWLTFIAEQILSNSLKYLSPERPGKIKIYSEELDGRTLLVFEDNGIGISSNDLPRIFEKSFTGENGRTGQKSTGMGLYIVKSLCVRLGHSLNAQSVKDQYTRITIGFAKNDFYKF